MPLPYPEGECYFKRSALKSGGWDAENLEHFGSHGLIEHVWNDWIDHGVNNSVWTESTFVNGRSHLGYASDPYPQQTNTNYTIYKELTVSFGHNKDGSNVDYLYRIGNCNNGSSYTDADKSGGWKICIRPCPVPSGYRFMFVDIVQPIRAIYIPQLQQADEKYPELCSYVMIDYTKRDKVTMQSIVPHNNERTFECDPTKGLGSTKGAFNVPGGRYDVSRFTLCLDLAGLLNFLILSPDMRDSKMDIYRMPTRGQELIQFW